MIETFELLMKSCKNLICYVCIFNVQLHVHLKKWTLNCKLLYLRNYLSYFNKIRRITCVNTHTRSLKVWLKSILPWLKYSIFSMGLFFLLTHPVYCTIIELGVWDRQTDGRADGSQHCFIARCMVVWDAAGWGFGAGSCGKYWRPRHCRATRTISYWTSSSNTSRWLIHDCSVASRD